MLDTRGPESDVHVQLEEEMDKIIMLAENFNERALSTTQILAATKRRKGLRNLRRNSVSSIGHKRRRKKLQPSGTEKLPLLPHKRPCLSPLAARAALAAAVTPLKQARRVILFENSQELSVHSARCKAGTSCMVAEDDPISVQVVYKEKHQNSSVTATMKRGDRFISSCSQFPGPIKETGSLLVNRCDHDVVENNDVQLIIDIPIYEGLLPPENALDLIIDIPILGT